ncbi:MAG: 2'-5' RNA ligase family protein [Chloroflexota bacterium]|nr:2'-5' RNA ligase family protein [Chloroflexota bacterium]
MSDSPPRRRIIVAVVTGDIGNRIQAWRVKHDPLQARRLPPHLTLCYWAPEAPPELIEAQVRHAFPRPVPVRLGQVHVFANQDQTYYVDVQDTGQLDAARRLLYDGAFIDLPKGDDWTWHVTYVRRGSDANQVQLRAAASELAINDVWSIDTVAYMQLRDDAYVTLDRWRLADEPPEQHIQ